MLEKKLKMRLQITAFVSISLIFITLFNTAKAAEHERRGKEHFCSKSEPYRTTEIPRASVTKTLSQSNPGNINRKKTTSDPMSIPTPKKNKPRNSYVDDNECPRKGCHYDFTYPQFIDLSPMSIEELENYKKESLRNEHPPSHIYSPSPFAYLNHPTGGQGQQQAHYNQNDMFY